MRFLFLSLITSREVSCQISLLSIKITVGFNVFQRRLSCSLVRYGWLFHILHQYKTWATCRILLMKLHRGQKGFVWLEWNNGSMVAFVWGFSVGFVWWVYVFI